MCGICGIVSRAGGSIEVGPVRLMLDALTHRGPDAWGILQAPGVVAGIRRLRVIDLATGDQPIANEDEQLHIVVNGEFYDYARYQRELDAISGD